MELEDYAVGRDSLRERNYNYESKLGFRGDLCK